LGNSVPPFTTTLILLFSLLGTWCHATGKRPFAVNYGRFLESEGLCRSFFGKFKAGGDKNTGWHRFKPDPSRTPVQEASMAKRRMLVFGYLFSTD